ncbi:hypothetical protein [Frigidibacter sp. MR17.24]|uniref:hypothetical protein n=1 Tax=Frigidibacter sp. MR17.24 TaxID=3127345 RepID=UPI003012EC6A
MTKHTFALPHITLPAITLPPITLPLIELPMIRLPSITLPSLAGLRPLALALALGAALLPATDARAAEPQLETALRDALGQWVTPWATDPAILAALRQANASHAALTLDDIAALDTAWAAEMNAPRHPTIDAVIDTPLSDLLRTKLAEAAGAIVEIIVMDDRGLNVAATDTTSDYWQGDEAKFTETFPKGFDAIHFGDVDFDDSTGQLVVQVSITVADPATHEPLGAMTVSFDASF